MANLYFSQINNYIKEMINNEKKNKSDSIRERHVFCMKTSRICAGLQCGLESV